MLHGTLVACHICASIINIMTLRRKFNYMQCKTRYLNDGERLLSNNSGGLKTR